MTEAEMRFCVDRRAIAGAIAWEALENVLKKSWRAVGPGKIHTYNFTLWPFLSADHMWIKEVEDRGLLPPQSKGDRTRIVSTPDGAIEYIGAIMDLIAIIYEDAGSPGICNPEIRMNPPILANAYQGSDPIKWANRASALTPTDVLRVGNKMAIWLSKSRNAKFIEEAFHTPSSLDDVLDPNQSRPGPRCGRLEWISSFSAPGH